MAASAGRGAGPGPGAPSAVEYTRLECAHVSSGAPLAPGRLASGLGSRHPGHSPHPWRRRKLRLLGLQGGVPACAGPRGGHCPRSRPSASLRPPPPPPALLSRSPFPTSPFPSAPSPETPSPALCKTWGGSRGRALCAEAGGSSTAHRMGGRQHLSWTLQPDGRSRDPLPPPPAPAWSRKDQPGGHSPGRLVPLPMRTAGQAGRGVGTAPVCGTVGSPGTAGAPSRGGGGKEGLAHSLPPTPGSGDGTAQECGRPLLSAVLQAVGGQLPSLVPRAQGGDTCPVLSWVCLFLGGLCSPQVTSPPELA